MISQVHLTQFHLLLLRENLQEMSGNTSTDRQVTGYETGEVLRVFGDVQFRSSAGDSAISIVVHLAHLRH